MTSLTVQDGKLVVRNGALGTTQACCCGGGCSGPCDEANPCPPSCRCNYTTTTNVERCYRNGVLDPALTTQAECVACQTTCEYVECQEYTYVGEGQECPEGWLADGFGGCSRTTSPASCNECSGNCYSEGCTSTGNCGQWTAVPLQSGQCVEALGCCVKESGSIPDITKAECDEAGGQWFYECSADCRPVPPNADEMTFSGQAAWFREVPQTFPDGSPYPWPNVITAWNWGPNPYARVWKDGYPEKFGCRTRFIWVEIAESQGCCTNIKWRERAYVWDCASQQFVFEDALQNPDFSSWGLCNNPYTENSLWTHFEEIEHGWQGKVLNGLNPAGSPCGWNAMWGAIPEEYIGDYYPEGDGCRALHLKCGNIFAGAGGQGGEDYASPGEFPGDPVFECVWDRLNGGNPLP